MVTDDLTTWLRERLDEDERLTRKAAATDGEWRWVDRVKQVIAARLLAEVDAKRRILELYDVSADRSLSPMAGSL